MRNRNTEDLQSLLSDFNSIMEGNGSGKTEEPLEALDNASDEIVVDFVRKMSSEQVREVVARIKARNTVDGYIDNRDIYNYCNEFDIVPENLKNNKW